MSIILKFCQQFLNLRSILMYVSAIMPVVVELCCVQCSTARALPCIRINVFDDHLPNMSRVAISAVSLTPVMIQLACYAFFDVIGYGIEFVKGVGLCDKCPKFCRVIFFEKKFCFC